MNSIYKSDNIKIHFMATEKIFHNGKDHEVDIQKFTSVCGLAKRMSMNHRPLIFQDDYSEEIFEIFIHLCKGSVLTNELDPKFVPALLQLIQDYDAPSVEQELERKILEQKNNKLVVSFVKAAPDHFSGLFSYIHVHFDQFKGIPELFDLPITALFRGLSSQETYSGSIPSNDRDYAEMFEATNNLKDQEKTLDNEKAQLDQQINHIKDEITNVDKENQNISKLCNETEAEIDNLRKQIQEKKKMVSSLTSQLKQENKAQLEAKKEADKAQNDLNNAKNKLNSAKQQYEKLLHQ